MRAIVRIADPTLSTGTGWQKAIACCFVAFYKSIDRCQGEV
ncbi:hypothetical protein [Microseira wollei]|nr:hypothetical protein [Microseira wollei]